MLTRNEGKSELSYAYGQLSRPFATAAVQRIKTDWGAGELKS